jgi:hypothetical protein
MGATLLSLERTRPADRPHLNFSAEFRHWAHKSVLAALPDAIMGHLTAISMISNRQLGCISSLALPCWGPGLMLAVFGGRLMKMEGKAIGG